MYNTYTERSRYSVNWRVWQALISPTICGYCLKMNGRILGADDILDKEPPVHPNCRCRIEALLAIHAGDATKDGQFGADFWVKNYGQLPDYYISGDEAEELGWINYMGNLHNVAPGKMIGGDLYQNKNGKLPSKPGRIWYEADINYTQGWRNRHRVVYSNDGLVFVTYNHYHTFYEII